MRTEELLANLPSSQSKQRPGAMEETRAKPPYQGPPRAPDEVPKFKVVDEDTYEQEPLHSRKYLKGFISVLKDVAVAFVIIFLIISVLFIYTGNWPPLVVVKSESMMHGTDSEVGVIDTGDMVLVKDVDEEDDIITYVAGEKSGHSTYGNFGDVIIFDKNGRGGTPVIHRAIMWVEYNTSGGGFDVPELDKKNVLSVSLPHFKSWGAPVDEPFVIDLGKVKNNILGDSEAFSFENGFSGYITKGDFNPGCDQVYRLNDSMGNPVGPVDIDWVIGKGRGELPWFGLIKLWADNTFRNDDEDKNKTVMPPTSVRNLWIVIFVLIGGTVAIDVTLIHLDNRKKKMDERMKFKEIGDPPPKKPGPMGMKGRDHTTKGDRPTISEEPLSIVPNQSVSKDDLLRGFKR